MLERSKVQGLGMTSLRTRQRLLERLTEKGIKDIRVLEAMRDTPRHLFLDEALASRAYEDLALPIGYQQTISQPYIVARMTEILVEDKKLESQPIDKALEVGSGGGYQAAILSRFSKSVLTIERIKALHDKAAKNLKKLKVRNVKLLFDDGSDLIEAKENYDAILFAAAPLEEPTYFLDKLSIGGRLIAPIGGGEVQDLSLIKRLSKNKYETEVVEQVLFVPFLGGKVE